MLQSLVPVRNSRRLTRPIASLGAGFVVLGASLAGCASGSGADAPPKRPPGGTETAGPRIATGRVGTGIALRDTRVEAFPGRVLVVPIGPEDAEGGIARTTPPDWRPRGVPEVALVTDEPLLAMIWRLRGTSAADLDGLDPWLAPPFDWRADPMDKARAEAEEGEVVLWFLAIEMPDRPVGRWLRVGGRKLPLEWAAVPELRAADPIEPRALPPEQRDRIMSLSARVVSDFSDPFRRWRMALLADRMVLPLAHVADDPILRDIDQQQRDRALAALARIRAVDAALADRIRAVLAAIITTPDGVLVPAWPPDPTPALSLFASVLREDRSDGDIRSDALAFLATAPPALAWIVDEGGPDGPSSAPTCALAIADRTGAPSIASVAPLGMQAQNAAQLDAFGSRLFTVDPAYPGEITTTTVTARAGVWQSEMRVLAGTVPARPPGITLGPLVPDWTHAAWAGGAPPRIDPRWLTVAVLQRQIDGSGVARGWEMLIEAQHPERSPDDAVTVWIGPMGATVAAIRITPEGEAMVIAGDLTGENLPVTIRVEDDRWIAQVALPAELTAVPRVRLAIERIDGRGVRSAWPRPMMPGQPEPGRLAVDLTAW